MPRISPLTADDVAAWTYECDYALTLRRGGDLAAYAEIVEDVVEQDVEIQHLSSLPICVRRAWAAPCLSASVTFLPKPALPGSLAPGQPGQYAPPPPAPTAAGFEAVAKMSGPRYQWYKKAASDPKV